MSQSHISMSTCGNKQDPTKSKGVLEGVLQPTPDAVLDKKIMPIIK